jgi:hypothetical protein
LAGLNEISGLSQTIWSNTLSACFRGNECAHKALKSLAPNLSRGAFFGTAPRDRAPSPLTPALQTMHGGVSTRADGMSALPGRQIWRSKS